MTTITAAALATYRREEDRWLTDLCPSREVLSDLADLCRALPMGSEEQMRALQLQQLISARSKLSSLVETYIQSVPATLEYENSHRFIRDINDVSDQLSSIDFDKKFDYPVDDFIILAMRIKEIIQDITQVFTSINKAHHHPYYFNGDLASYYPMIEELNTDCDLAGSVSDHPALKSLSFILSSLIYKASSFTRIRIDWAVQRLWYGLQPTTSEIEKAQILDQISSICFLLVNAPLSPEGICFRQILTQFGIHFHIDNRGSQSCTIVFFLLPM